MSKGYAKIIVIVLLVLVLVIGFFVARKISLRRYSGTAGSPTTQSTQSLNTNSVNTTNINKPLPSDAQIIFSQTPPGVSAKGAYPISELYSMTSSGQDITQLTSNNQAVNHFAVSPDRTKIAVNWITGDTNHNGQIDAADQKEIWILNLNDGSKKKISGSSNAGFGGVVWASDNQAVYASVGDQSSGTDIYKIDLSGNMTNLTQNLGSQLGFSGRKFVSDVGSSHDGKLISFIFVQGERKTKLVVANSDGSGAHIVDNGGPLPPGQRGAFSVGDFDPEISPDDSQVIFEQATDDGYNGNLSSGALMVVNIDGTNVHQITPLHSIAAYGIPDWSTDNKIVCSEWNQKDNFTGIDVLNPDGSNLHRIETGGSHARWIPTP